MIRTTIVPEDLAFAVHVLVSKPTTADDWQNIFDELDQAMDTIEAKLTDIKTHSFLIRLRVEGFDTERFFGWEDEKPYRFTLYNPWDDYSPDFWLSTLAEPALKQKVERWLLRHANTLKSAKRAMRSTASLWEDNTTQFGEPLLALLAMMDVTFVSYYEQFLEVWDLSHQVSILPAIAGVLDHHGVRAETERLAEIYACLDR